MNLFILGYFKYTDFFIENINNILGSNIQTIQVLLPLAISFFTFQQISYLVDSYRGETYEYSFMRFALYVSFFPQLIAGPIVYHKEIMPQFTNNLRKVNFSNINLGIFIFSIGFFKKTVLADTFSIWVVSGFDSNVDLPFFEAWFVSLSYTFQLYFDFSGYADMAIGSALLFNIKLPVNFQSPYKSLNIKDFWRTWHITLGRFIRDYLYIPLGGNQSSQLKNATIILITFILAGVWHGAGWNFLIWGALHGVAYLIHRFWVTTNIKLHPIISWLICFNFINITWIFFRANEWSDALRVLKGMVGFNGILLPGFLSQNLEFLENFGFYFGGFLGSINGTVQTPLYILIGLCVVLCMKNTSELAKYFKEKPIWMFFSLIVFFSACFSLNESTNFLYYNF